MKVKFLHLFPNQLGLNGEGGNLTCLIQRLSWAGIESEVQIFEGEGSLPSGLDAIFIGSGTLAGAIEALNLLSPRARDLEEMSESGIPFLALGLGWEILGSSILLLDGTTLDGAGVFPSRSVRTNVRASAESYGFDEFGNLTTGYANHSSEIELIGDAEPLIELKGGYGNSSTKPANLRSDEGLVRGNLMAARLNGPLLPLNPHLADRFLGVVANRTGFTYEQRSEEAHEADEFASKARSELRQRLAG